MPKTSPSGAPWRNFYGRIRGKTLRDSQKGYLTDLEDIGLPGVSWEENPERAPLDVGALFEGKPLWLEVGFGGGEHLVHQAVANPHVGLIGAEPYINGVAMLLGKIRGAGATNIRVHPGDARDLMDVLPDGSVEKAFLLYPDPWPKTRHHRRRFVTAEHLEPLYDRLAPGAEFRIATDIGDYVRQAMEEVPKAGFLWQAEHPRDSSSRMLGWPRRYDQKCGPAPRRSDAAFPLRRFLLEIRITE